MSAQLDQYCQDRDNNLNLIRFIAAACVLVSHAHPITLGTGAAEPLEAVIGRSLGWVSVAIFFVISGFLITQSFQRTSFLTNWASARFLRIFPGLLVVLLITLFVLGPMTTILPWREYFSHAETLTYIPRNLSLAFLQYPLPGVFANNAYPEAINGSLWTLVYEVICYALVFALGIFGLFRSKQRSFIALTIILIAYIGYRLLEANDIGHPRITALSRLVLPFAIGIAMFQWRENIVLKWRYGLALGVVALALYQTIFFTEAFIVWLSYITFLLAYLPKGAIRKYNNFGDFSYGLYIYAFPIQQAVAFYIAPQTPFGNIIIAFPITLLLAILSWKWVEKPALDHRHRFSEILRGAIAQTQLSLRKRT